MDGASLTKSRAQWEAALNGAIDHFRTLVAESSSKSWKPVPHAPTAVPHSANPASNASSLRGSPAIGSSASTTTAAAKGKAREQTLRPARSVTELAGAGGATSSGSLDGPSTSTAADPQQPSGPFLPKALRSDSVLVHRRSGKGADIYRAVAEVPYDGQADLVSFQSILQTPDARSMWDRLVDGGELIEQLDPSTRICKTNYRLGWPASPRDAITISRTLADDSMLIDVSTSLPRSPDAPAYLRPAPPCVRSHVHLMAWCLQVVPAADASGSGGSSNLPATTQRASQPRIKISVFWSWDLKGAWMGMPTGGLGVHLPDLVKGLVRQVREGGSHLPAMLNFGSCVEVLSNSFDPSRDTRVTEYAIVVEDEVARRAEDAAEKDLDTLTRIRARRRLEAGVEFTLPASEGWDVRVDVRTQTKSSQNATWHAVAERPAGSQRILLTIKHAKLEDVDELVKATVRLQRVAASTGLRLNDSPFEIANSEPRTAAALSHRIVEDAASVSNVSIGTASTGGSTSAAALGAMANASRGGTPNPGSPGAINALIRRNYIYFTSLLQEPEAKWKPVTDTRGVTVMQLDSIDPTLVVYRAEATFVGVSVWDLFGTISNPGAQAFWDKSLDDATLLSDVTDLSSLWHVKTKPNWPVSARDAVTVQTSYKSPASVHIFSFSSDDRVQFPAIPAPEAGTIRTQIDLRGWSVEALSPTTVHVTMLEQSDPKGWTSKSATPSAMVSAVAGVGEYAIKFGGPPVATRLLGAQARASKYDHEKATYRIEYEANDVGGGGGDGSVGGDASADAPNVECEIRCDIEVWATSLDLVVDPPPISVSCLRRHKLSQGGGGLWLTIEHVAASLEDDLARITVRKGSSREKGSVFVNGAPMRVDVDEIKGDEVKQLSKQKRTKPQRVPLDLNTAPRKSAASKSSAALDSSASSVVGSETSDAAGSRGGGGGDGDRADDAVPPSASAMTVRAGAAAPARDDETPMPTANTFFSDERPRQPMTCALDVLFLLRRIHAERAPDPAGTPAGWALVSERNGLYVRRKLMESISSTVVVQRGDKVVQGLSAEDLVDVVSSLGCRSQWDDKVESTTLLECYGNGATTSFVTTKASFPFRGRAFHLASLTARAAPPAFALSVNGSDAHHPASSPSSSSAFSGPSVYFHASASFPEQNSRYAQDKVNPQGLPMGKVLIDGWILETLDPYSSTNFQIPSTRCTHVVAVDYAGSLPVAVNTLWNSNLPRSVLAIEAFLKTRGALPSIKTPPPCVQVLGDGRDEDQGLVWVLDDPDRKHLLLSTSFEPSSRTFTALSLTKAASHSEPGASTSQPLTHQQLQQLHQQSAEPVRAKGKTVSDASTTKAAALRAMSSTATLTPAGSTKPTESGGGPPSAGGVGLSRATSMNSIASTSVTSTPSTLRSRPSAIRADSRKATDMLLMEVEVELRHFSKGYDVHVFSEFLPTVATDAKKKGDGASAAEDGTDKEEAAQAEVNSKPNATTPPTRRETLPLSMAKEPKQDLPIQLKVFDLPPSAVLAATLDPSARPRKHLIRATLATTAFLNPIEDPLTGSKPPDVPEWYTRLQASGAVLRLVVKPLNPQALTEAANSLQGISALFSTPAGKVPVKSGGAKLEVMHVNQTSAMLQREQVGGEPYAQLRRAVPPTPATVSGSEVDDDTDTGVGNSAAPQQQQDSRLPSLLRDPVVADLELRKQPPNKAAAGSATAKANGSAGSEANDAAAEAGQKGGGGKSGDGAAITTAAGAAGASASAPSGSASAATTGAKAGKTTQGEGKPTPQSKAETSSTSSLIHILNSYPLSRLGTSSALASVSSITAKGSTGSTYTPGSGSDAASSAHGPTDLGSSSSKVGEDGAAPGTTTTVAGVKEATASAASAVVAAANRKRFSGSSVLMIALIAFLLGSLVRSFLAPVDYVLLPPSSSSSGSASSPAGVDGGDKRAVLPLQKLLEGVDNEDDDVPPPSTRLREAVLGGLGERAGALSGEVERYLSLLAAASGGGGSGGGSESSSTSSRSLGIEGEETQPTTTTRGKLATWHELRRLVEVKRVWGGWTVVVALMRR